MLGRAFVIVSSMSQQKKQFLVF